MQFCKPFHLSNHLKRSSNCVFVWVYVCMGSACVCASLAYDIKLHALLGIQLFFDLILKEKKDDEYRSSSQCRYKVRICTSTDLSCFMKPILFA